MNTPTRVPKESSPLKYTKSAIYGPKKRFKEKLVPKDIIENQSNSHLKCKQNL